MKKRSLTAYQDSEFYFDDCAICQSMKQAEDENRELGLSELKAVFKKANNKSQRKR